MTKTNLPVTVPIDGRKIEMMWRSVLGHLELFLAHMPCICQPENAVAIRRWIQTSNQIIQRELLQNHAAHITLHLNSSGQLRGCEGLNDFTKEALAAVTLHEPAIGAGGHNRARRLYLLAFELACSSNKRPPSPKLWGPIRYAPFRREELCYLEWSDVDFVRETIAIQYAKPAYGWRPKRDGRTMDLHPRLKQILAKQRHANTFVLNHPGGRAYESLAAQRRELGRRAWRKIKSLCDVLSLAESDQTGSWKRRFPRGPHLKAFRSGVSVELQLKGAPLAYVQNQLGHHDQSMTLEHYSHLVPELMGSLTKRFMGYLGGDPAKASDATVSNPNR